MRNVAHFLDTSIYNADFQADWADGESRLMMLWLYDQGTDRGMRHEADSTALLSGIYDRLCELEYMTYNLGVSAKGRDDKMQQRLHAMNPLRERHAGGFRGGKETQEQKEARLDRAAAVVSGSQYNA